MKRMLVALGLVALTASAAFAEKAEGPAEPTKPRSQTEKMKLCNVQAKEQNLKGQERRTFMSQCLRAEKKS